MGTRGKITKEEKEAISKRKSVSVVAKEHSISPQTLNRMLKNAGRLTGEPGNYYPTPDYKQYEHPTQGSDYGYSYDPPFFEGIDYSEENIKKAAEENRVYRRQQKEQKENRKQEIIQKRLDEQQKQQEKKSIINFIKELWRIFF